MKGFLVKKLPVVCFLIFLALLTIGCTNGNKTEEVNETEEVSGNGEIVPLSGSEVKEFIRDDHTGFIYAFNQESENKHLKSIKEAATNEKIKIYSFDTSTLNNEGELNQYLEDTSRPFAFYYKGKLEGGFDPDDIVGEKNINVFESFIQDMTAKFVYTQ